MVAFDAAVHRWRTQMLELDVHVTRDGQVVVAHDATVDRCTDGRGAIADLWASELAELDAGFRFSQDGGLTFPFRGRQVRIPLLAEALGRFPNVLVNVDVKAGSEGVESQVAAVIREAGATSRVCIGSEDDSMAGRLVRALPEACHFYPRIALTELVIAIKRGGTIGELGPYLVLDMPLYFGETRLVDESFIERARSLGRWVNVWTVDDPDEMRALIREGVGGIMTDRPDLLRAVMDEKSEG
ncbi:MAG: glycerophosphodiester phosphodiesterase [Deltaproteobacteria bacterium]|nr:glycerophosphodiester phosphodiesterase [Deltaproteobacteria bacterium]